MELNNKEDLKRLRAILEDALKSAIPSLRFKLGNMRFESGGNYLKVPLEIVAGKSKIEIDLEKNAPLDGVDTTRQVILPEEGYGRCGGSKAMLTGYRVRAPKYPYMMDIINGEYVGRVYTISKLSAKAMFGYEC